MGLSVYREGYKYSNSFDKIAFTIILLMEDDEFPFSNDYDWKKKHFLGEGSFGKVFKVSNIKDNQFYAIKQMNMDAFNQDKMLMESLKGEIAITSEVCSTHTVKMINYKFGKRYTYIILQLCDSDLRTELTSHKFSEDECVHSFEQILEGFKVLVHKGYIHRDIKPANVLVKSKIYKVADFGFACKADIQCRKRMTDICGTPVYMAPQLLKNQPYTAKSDIWSLGLMLYEMLFDYPPWPCRSYDQYMNAVLYTPLKFPYNAKLGTHTKDFIVRSLVIDEGKRMSWQEVFNHPLVKHRNTGQDAPQVEVDNYVKNILLRIQTEIQKQNVNLNLIIEPYRGWSLDLLRFTELVGKINPQITTHEISTLFKYLDVNKSGTVEWAVIQHKIFNVDFRETTDVLSRKIEELAAIFKAKGESPDVLFNKIDTNHSGFLDYTEFNKFISQLAPLYTNQEKLKFFQLFDADKNGLISKKQFSDLLQKYLPDNNKESGPTQRGKRNLNMFVQYLKWSAVSAETFVKIADKNKDGKITLDEFNSLLNVSLSFNITMEEVQEVFKLIDTHSSGSIEVQEIVALMK